MLFLPLKDEKISPLKFLYYSSGSFQPAFHNILNFNLTTETLTILNSRIWACPVCCPFILLLCSYAAHGFIGNVHCRQIPTEIGFHPPPISSSESDLEDHALGSDVGDGWKHTPRPAPESCWCLQSSSKWVTLPLPMVKHNPIRNVILPRNLYYWNICLEKLHSCNVFGRQGHATPAVSQGLCRRESSANGTISLALGSGLEPSWSFCHEFASHPEIGSKCTIAPRSIFRFGTLEVPTSIPNIYAQCQKNTLDVILHRMAITFFLCNG